MEVTHGDVTLKELDRIANELKLRGVAWNHVRSGVAINHPFMRPILKTMQQLRLIPFIHCHFRPYESLWMLEVLAGEFPNITFVALGALGEDASEAIQLGTRRKNILFDTGPVLSQREKGVEAFVKRVGSDRLLFGSDLYAMQPSYRRPTTTLEVIRNTVLTEDEKANILRHNTMRLFGLSDGVL